jgi:hypothetical protein
MLTRRLEYRHGTRFHGSMIFLRKASHTEEIGLKKWRQRFIRCFQRRPEEPIVLRCGSAAMDVHAMIQYEIAIGDTAVANRISGAGPMASRIILNGPAAGGPAGRAADEGPCRCTE